MIGLLLAIIYLAFISLGLPDSLLGSAWPTIHLDLNVPLANMGIITMIISGGTIISSLFADKLTRKFGTSWVTIISIFLTAGALLGFSFSNSFILLCIFAIPYGVGAGAIDASLNNYVALHYSSRHMSWLHCFWGVGTIISPYIMSFALTNYNSWNLGYRIVGIVQICIAFIVLASLPLWKKVTDNNEEEEVIPAKLTFKEKLKIDGIFFVLIGFFAYCAYESTVGGWAATYLVQAKGIDKNIAAAYNSLFFIGITFGRFLSGFVTNKIGDKWMIRIGSFIMLIGLVLLVLPVPYNIVSLIGFVVIGLGCAPIYPAIIHSTPSNFGKENSQAIIGLQMASAYVGSTFMPPLFGLIANNINVELMPLFLLVFWLLLLVMIELLNRRNTKLRKMPK